jgi:RND family efflux transporter MFP subunit
LARRFRNLPGRPEGGHYTGPAQAGRYIGPAQAGRYVLLALLICGACGSKEGDEATEPVEVPTITADVAQVGRKTLAEELTVRGTVAAVPNEDVKVSSLVAGVINELSVAEGDSVAAKQIIARIDRRPLEDQRRQASAAVDQAKAQVENARLNLTRTEQLFQRGIAAGKEVEDARTQMAAAQSALEQTAASLNTANLQIERADVRSPIGGQIVKRMVSVGEQVDGTAAQPIVEIANLDRVEIAANVPAEQLTRVKVGQAATMSTEAYAGHTFKGSVIAVAPAVDPATNAALVRIRITNANRLLRVGVFAEARLQLAEHANALVVPPSAIVRNEEGAAVYVVQGDIAQRTPVKVGLEQPGAVEILEGVTEGQTVLTSSVYGLGDKARLAKPSDKEKADDK